MDNKIYKVCAMCGRSESEDLKIITLGGINICTECLEKSASMVNNLPNMEKMQDIINNLGVNFPNNINQENMEDNKKVNEEDSFKETKLNNSYKNDSDPSMNCNNRNKSINNNDEGEDLNDDNKSDNNTPDNKSFDIRDILGKPGVHVIGSGDINDFKKMMEGINGVKPKKKEEESDEPFNWKDIPAPHIIKEKLDEYVIGQEEAKKVISVAVYNHYKRIGHLEKKSPVEIEKSNVLLLGPTGCGKTYLVRTLAKLLNVPLAISDATSITEAGYVGDDIESVLSNLLMSAGNSIKKAERGIVFIDEIDKLAKKKSDTHRDISGESVQQGLLKLLEGSVVEVPVGTTSKNPLTPMARINTSNILFICGGAFPDMDKIIKERLNSESRIGFTGDTKDKYDEDKTILSKIEPEDLRAFGMIPEFIGRLPIITTMDKLDYNMLASILKTPKNAIIKQYEELLKMEEVSLVFEEDAVLEIAKKAEKRETGARALRSIMEKIMLDVMYEIPKDDNIGAVVITKEYIMGVSSPIIKMRGTF